MKEVFTSDNFGQLNREIESFMEDHDVYDWGDVTIVIEKVPDDENATPGELQTSYHWKATLAPLDTKEALTQQLVEEHGIVRHLWNKTDIQDWAAKRRT